MRDAINVTNRQVYFSLNNLGSEDVWTWGATVGNSWRTTQDIQNTFESIKYNF